MVVDVSQPTLCHYKGHPTVRGKRKKKKDLLIVISLFGETINCKVSHNFLFCLPAYKKNHHSEGT